MNNRLRSNGRSGHYVRQPNGFSAFIPKPLPPLEPPIDIDDELQMLLSEANLAQVVSMARSRPYRTPTSSY